MANLNVYKQNGEAAGSMTVSDRIFGADYNEALIHEVVVAQQANARQGTKCTLTRAEVRGGGRKPWRQKHTGKARQGSIRAPQWIKGGVVFAPKPRDFSKKVNKQAKEVALFSALSEKIRDESFIVLDSLALKEVKTREMASVLKAFKLEKSVLLVIPSDSPEIMRAANNIPNLTLVCSDLINVYDIVKHDCCLVLKDAVKKIEEAYAQ